MPAAASQPRGRIVRLLLHGHLGQVQLEQDRPTMGAQGRHQDTVRRPPTSDQPSSGPMADHRCRKRNDDDHEGGDTDDRAVCVPVMVRRHLDIDESAKALSNNAYSPAPVPVGSQHVAAEIISQADEFDAGIQTVRRFPGETASVLHSKGARVDPSGDRQPPPLPGGSDYRLPR